jgi:hypothetical protein
MGIREAKCTKDVDSVFTQERPRAYHAIGAFVADSDEDGVGFIRVCHF